MTAAERTDELDRLETAFADAALADRIEMTLRPLGDDRYRATAVDGAVQFRRDAVDGRHEYAVESVTGRHPLAHQDDGHLVGLDTERVAAGVTRTDNAYPHAFDSIAQFFDSPNAPDLLVTSTAGHHTGGQHGRHGSLGVVQARAPFIAAGAGVQALGMVDASTRTVDVAPTVAALLDLAVHPDGVGPTGAPRSDARLRRQDGDPVEAILDGSRADHVVVLLLDGCNANLLHDAIDAGEAPNIAGLIGRGTAYRHGAMASLPTATLANHTTAVTGAHPGHSGVLHNAWLDRRDGSSPELLAMDQMFWAMRHLDPSVETLFRAVARSRPGAFTSATFEFADAGATFSSFALVRDGAGGSALPELDEATHVDGAGAGSSDVYRFMSRVDHLSVAHTIACWEQRARQRAADVELVLVRPHRRGRP